MSQTATPTTAPPWRRHAKKPKLLPVYEPSGSGAFSKTLREVGLTLSIGIALILVLSGCSSPPVVVTAKCPEYPLPHPSLLRDPLNRDLIPHNMLPSRSRLPSASSGSTTQ